MRKKYCMFLFPPNTHTNTHRHIYTLTNSYWVLFSERLKYSVIWADCQTIIIWERKTGAHCSACLSIVVCILQTPSFHMAGTIFLLFQNRRRDGCFCCGPWVEVKVLIWECQHSCWMSTEYTLGETILETLPSLSQLLKATKILFS
jgi:hypothetical protein